MSTHRRRSSLPAAAPPLEDEDLLSEIILLLPPEPCSLPRAYAVCKCWRRLVSDPGFIRRFRRHHRRNPTLLGFFDIFRGFSFQPTLEAPNRVPPGRFSLQLDDGDEFQLINSRHGFLLFIDQKQKRVLVWDPVTGDQHRFALPTATGFGTDQAPIVGAVLRADGEVHHFQVVCVVADEDEGRALACVYSSETGLWGDLIISTPLPSEAHPTDDFPTNVCMPAVMVDSVYWPLVGDLGTSSYILEFNLERQGLAVIELPVDMSEDGDLTAMRAEGGGLGFLLVSEANFSAQLWKRKADSDGVVSWVLERTIELDKLLSLNSEKEREFLRIVGFAECSNVVVLWTGIGPFMVELESLQFKKLPETNTLYHPFESVYAVPGSPLSLSSSFYDSSESMLQSC